MKRLLCFGLAALLLAGCLAGCGGGETYTLFASDTDGYIQEAVGISSELVLRRGGKGRMTINGKSGSVRWREEDGVLTLTAGEDSMSGTLSDGILILTVAPDALWYYATADADTSSIPVLTQSQYILGLMKDDD